MTGADGLFVLCLVYDWRAVPEHGLVVDIGSGLGHVSVEIASVRPDLDFVLEDRAIVLQDAKEVCLPRCLARYLLKY